MTVNKTFETMSQEVDRWGRIFAGLRKEKDALFGRVDYESPEFQDVLNRLKKAEAEYPFSHGQLFAFHVVDKSIEKGLDEVEIFDCCWEKDMHDFVETLRSFGVDTFVVTDTSTALMRSLHRYAAEGCTMLGLCEFKKKENLFGTEREEIVQGVRFKMN